MQVLTFVLSPGSRVIGGEKENRENSVYADYKDFSFGEVIWEDVSVHKTEQSGAQSQDKGVEQGKNSSPGRSLQ